MHKTICISILLFKCLLILGQTDDKKISDINHYGGLDIGYSYYPKFVNNNLEYNLNYFFNPHYFFMKAQFGIAPSTNMGIIYKAFSTMGFSTKTSKIVSWHFLTGIGLIFHEKTFNNSRFKSLGPIVESGFYLNFFNSKNKIIGLNVVAFTQEYRDRGIPGNGISMNANVSLNIKLNK